MRSVTALQIPSPLAGGGVGGRFRQAGSGDPTRSQAISNIPAFLAS
jgi:hypothetical protein